MTKRRLMYMCGSRSHPQDASAWWEKRRRRLPPTDRHPQDARAWWEERDVPTHYRQWRSSLFANFTFEYSSKDVTVRYHDSHQFDFLFSRAWSFFSYWSQLVSTRSVAYITPSLNGIQSRVDEHDSIFTNNDYMSQKWTGILTGIGQAASVIFYSSRKEQTTWKF